MRVSQYRQLAEQLQDRTTTLLLRQLRPADFSRRCPALLVLSCLVLAAARRLSLAAVAAVRPACPSRETLRQALYATLPHYDALRRRLPALLRATLPRSLRRPSGRRRRYPLAIDLHRVPYYKRGRTPPPHARKGQRVQGTRWARLRQHQSAAQGAVLRGGPHPLRPRRELGRRHPPAAAAGRAARLFPAVCVHGPYLLVGRGLPLPATGPYPVRAAGAGTGQEGQQARGTDRHARLLRGPADGDVFLPDHQPAGAPRDGDHPGAATQPRGPERAARPLRLGLRGLARRSGHGAVGTGELPAALSHRVELPAAGDRPGPDEQPGRGAATVVHRPGRAAGQRLADAAARGLAELGAGRSGSGLVPGAADRAGPGVAGNTDGARHRCLHPSAGRGTPYMTKQTSGFLQVLL